MSDFIIIATADWEHPLWTNKQHIAVSLADLGHRVLYVESLGLRGPRSDRSDLRRILRRLSQALLPPRIVRKGLWVWSPLVMPGGTKGLFLWFNRFSFGLGLTCAKLWTGMHLPVLWSFNPLTHEYLSLKGFRGTIYHCVDQVHAQPGMPAQLLEVAEKQLCRSVDIVFTTSPKLQESLKVFNDSTYFFGNVADADHFAKARDGLLACPNDLMGLQSPLILFIGAIDAYKLDLCMLKELASATSEWTYVFIGPVGETDPSTDITALDQLENVYFLGPRSYEVLPAYLAQADVSILPLKINAYTQHMFPMKFFEYLAAGSQVVATAIPSLLDLGDVALLCEPNAADFHRAIETVLAGNGPLLSERLKRAGLHTYRRRTVAMLEVLSRHGLVESSMKSVETA